MKDYPQPRAARTCAALVTGEAQSALRHTAPPIPGRGDRPAGGRAIAWTIKPLVAAIIAALAAPALAAPKGGVVVAGSASIGQSGNTTTINQSGQRVAINWTNFSVGAGEAVRFKQPNAAAMALNRVTGRESSAILGSLTANGQVFIVNPNGVLFGKGAQVNVGGLVATTLGISNQDFMAGNFRFNGSAGGSVVNEGHITVAPGGKLALIAPLVSNSGTISAPGGSVLLAAAEAVTLTLLDGSPLAYTLDKGSLQALVDNGGIIQADGGHVVLTAQGVDSLSHAAVNHSGVIEARSVGEKSGVVELFADKESGQVNLGGKLDASAPNGGNGGFIETSAAKVIIADSANVTTLAKSGKTGTWLIDPTDFTVEAGEGPRTVSSIGVGTLTKILEGSGVTIATDYPIATAPGGTEQGDITINAPILWTADTTLTLQAHRDIHINQFITATGNHAGLILGYGAGRDYYLDSGAQVNLAGLTPTLKIGVAGSEASYTVINNLNALQAISGNLNGKYALGTDISAAATAGWNGGLGFAPIGSGTRFAGIFTGLGHTITDLYINRPSEFSVGLFGVSSGTLRDVGLVGGSVNGYGAVGALAGTNQGTVDNAYASTSMSRVEVRCRCSVGGLFGVNSGTIMNSHASGIVTGGLGGYVGGLVGENVAGGTVTGSYATGQVEGRQDFHVGGLVGSNKGAIIESYATGDVTGNTAQGGLVGVNYPTGTITRSYATGSVTGTGITQFPTAGSVGGLVGQAGDDYSSGGGTIRDSYATGRVLDMGDRSPTYVLYHNGGLVGMTLSNTHIINSYSSSAVSGEGILGGLVGYFYNPNTITNSYWDTQTSGRATSAGGVGKTTAQMQQQATFTGWDFTNTWRIAEGVSAPVLRTAAEAAAEAAAHAAAVRAAAVRAAAEQAASAQAAAEQAAKAQAAAAQAALDAAEQAAKAQAAATEAATKANVKAAADAKVQSDKATDDAQVAADTKVAADKLARDTKAAADALAAASETSSDLMHSADHLKVFSFYREPERTATYEVYNFSSTSGVQAESNPYSDLQIGVGTRIFSLEHPEAIWKKTFVPPIPEKLYSDPSPPPEVVQIVLEDSKQEALRKEFKADYISASGNEVAADVLSLAFASVIGSLQSNGLATKIGIGKFISTLPFTKEATNRMAKEIFKEAKKIDWSTAGDLAKGWAYSMICEILKAELKIYLEVDNNTIPGRARNWLIDQAFIVTQVVLTGGSPLALVIGEASQTLEYIEDLRERSQEIAAQNISNITSVAQTLNGIAMLANKALDVQDPSSKATLLKIVKDGMAVVNNDILPNIGLGYGSGTSLVPITMQLMSARLYLLRGDTSSAIELIYEVQQYGYSIGGGSEDSPYRKAVFQLIDDMKFYDSVKSILRQG
jgi:filamentous hemagglutinin family protein